MGGILFGVDIYNQSTFAPTTYEKFSTFSPVYAPTLGYQLDYAYAPTIAIQSPETVGAVTTTKKEMTQTPDVTGATSEQSPTTSPTLTGPTSDPMGIILILGLVAVGGYVLVGMMKKKKE